ncbi:hypothetical protein [Nesterenkonia suensis]
MTRRDHTGSPLPVEDVRHRLSQEDAAWLGLHGWRRWSQGGAVASPRQAKLQVGLCLFIASAQLFPFLDRAISGPLGGWDRWVTLLGVIVFYGLALVTYAVYRGNVDDGVYERLAAARGLEAQERDAARTRESAQEA